MIENSDYIEMGISGVDELRLVNKRASTNTFASNEMDYVCFNKVFTIKTRTFINFKKSIQMLKPFGVLLIMIVVLIGLFRLDVLTGSQMLAGDNDDDE
jgi:hypothetical protein